MLELEGPPEPNDVSSDSGEEYVEKDDDVHVTDEDDYERILYGSDEEDGAVKKVMPALPGKKSKKEKGGLRKEVHAALGASDGKMREVSVKDTKRKPENEL
jgi:hypothetical protein